MSHIRRIVLALMLAAIAACSTIQAPVQTVAPIVPAVEVKPEAPVVPVVKPKVTELVESAQDSDQELIRSIAIKFSKSEKVIREIVKQASIYAQPIFPTRNDILAIIAVESGYDQASSYRGSKGLMQVLVHAHRNEIHGNFDIPEQIRVGVAILIDAFKATGGTRKAAVMAYNVGPGGYLRGARPTKYYMEFNKQLDWLKLQERTLHLV